MTSSLFSLRHLFSLRALSLSILLVAWSASFSEALADFKIGTSNFTHPLEWKPIAAGLAGELPHASELSKDDTSSALLAVSEQGNAMAVINTGNHAEETYEIYFLDHNHPESGWQKRENLLSLKDCSHPHVYYGLGRFFVFAFHKEKTFCVVASSIDQGNTWTASEIPELISGESGQEIEDASIQKFSLGLYQITSLNFSQPIV
ncbi:MAG: hypothetical protein ACOYK6_08625 [Chthoniobacterales bacterium]